MGTDRCSYKLNGERGDTDRQKIAQSYPERQKTEDRQTNNHCKVDVPDFCCKPQKKDRDQTIER